MNVRSYLDSDAAALAELLNRNQYGPITTGHPLTPQTLRAVFRERIVTHCVIGERDGVIHGCIALCRGSGRRSTAASERFAGLFVIDTTHRNSMLAGTLFQRIFAESIRDGNIRTLRLEVNPTNARAIPLYLRGGFRAAPGARPDEDGYIEMVSHLPGVIADLMTANSGGAADRIAPLLNLRMMRGSRHTDLSRGIEPVGEQLIVNYSFHAGALQCEAQVNFDTGALTGMTQLAGEPIVMPALHENSAHPSQQKSSARNPETLLRTQLSPDFTVEMDDAGTLEVSSSLGSVVLRQMWPVVLGVDSPAVRRQDERRMVRLTRLNHTSWLFTAVADSVEVTLRIVGPGVLRVDTRPVAPEGSVVASPWVTLRKAVLACDETHEQPCSGPVLPGLWPRNWLDFEAAAPFSNARRAHWSDAAHHLTVSWHGKARFAARSAPRLQSDAPGRSVTQWFACELVLPKGERTAGRGQVVPVPAAPGLREVFPAARRRGGPIAGGRSPDRMAVPEVTEHGRDAGRILAVDTAEQRWRIVPECGAVEWRVNDEPVLRGGYPAGVELGALARCRTGLWAVMLGPRTHPDQGAEWVADTDSVPFQGEGGERCSEAGWTVRVAGTDTSEVCVWGGTPGEDAAVCVLPDVSQAAEVSVAVGRRLWRIVGQHVPEPSWRGSVDAVVVSLRTGQALLVTPLEEAGAGAEVLIRSIETRLLLVVLGRITGSRKPALRVRFDVCESHAAAEQRWFEYESRRCGDV